MLRQKWLAVHAPNQHHLKVCDLVRCQAAAKVMWLAFVKAEISPVEREILHAALRFRPLQQRRKGRASPFRGAHRLVHPRHRETARADPGATVPRTFQRDRTCHLRQRADLVHRQRIGRIKRAFKGQHMLGLRQHRHIEMVEQVMRASGCDLQPQRFQQRARIAVRKCHFLTREHAFRHLRALGPGCKWVLDHITSSDRSSLSP